MYFENCSICIKNDCVKRINSINGLKHVKRVCRNVRIILHNNYFNTYRTFYEIDVVIFFECVTVIFQIHVYNVLIEVRIFQKYVDFLEKYTLKMHCSWPIG